ncbi:MAG: hypothetical protein K1W20_03455 [Lachnospiraceae bacterium]
MKDILLDADGDIRLTEEGDILLVTSPVQEVLIKLRWYFAEWVFDPDKGIPWFESVLVKNPDVEGIKKRLIREILDVDDVLEVTGMDISVNTESRNACVIFQFRTDKETYDEEVILHG